MDNKKILIVLLIIFVLCIFCICLTIGGYFLFVQNTELDPFSSGTSPTLAAVNPDPAATTQAEQIEQPAESAPQEPTPDPNQQKWLVMLYQDADDEILEQDIFFDANEAEYAGSSDRVIIVSQLDRFAGAFEGDGDWSSARRFYFTPDDDLNGIASQQIEDLGEANMGDPATLINFATWAIGAYPADRYVLVLSDHGAGWHGGWSDEDNNDSTGLRMQDIDVALGDIIARTGIEKFDIVVFDACLMSQLESLTMIQPHARIAVASEETVPSIGIAYNGFLSELRSNPAMSPEDLARSMVSTYIDQDLRIVNDDARDQFVSDAFNYNGMTTPEEVAVEIGVDITLSAVNLEAIPNLNRVLNALVYEMTFIDQSAVAQARTYAQSYYNLYGPDVPPSFIDLGNFVQLLITDTDNSDLSTAGSRLFAALDEAVIAERHGPERPGSTGISIYFPNSKLYQSDFAGYDAYNNGLDRFVEFSQWDDFLAFHYSGTPFDPDYTGPVIPAPGTQLTAPGLGDIDIGSLMTSAQTVSPGEPVHIETQVSGDNIGYIYFFAGKYFPESSSYLAIDADFIVSENTKDVNGVYYPDWGGGTVDVSIDWTPYTYFINDGSKSEFAVLYPLYYGATRDQNVYAVDGMYTFGDSGDQTYAVMSFGSDGWMIEVFSFQPEGGGPREILPTQGDSFTLLLKAIAISNDPGQDPEFVEFEGGTLTFGSTNFYWDSTLAEPGDYVAGVGALDLDGNYNLDFVPVVIE